ncbi:tyrosine-type recombinase/integrase [Streptomyces olivoreticuli]
MGFAEHRGAYWRGRYKIAPGKYGTVHDSRGQVVKFRTKREAKQAADAAEAQIRADGPKAPAAEQITFGAYAAQWYADQDLAASTMQNYRKFLENHLLPAFEDRPLPSIRRTDVGAWEKREKALYATSSVTTWRGLLSAILADAVDDGLIAANPATKRRGRGKRAGRSRERSPEKVITDPLGIILIAERLALLSGRDDEFVMGVTDGYTGERWGELIGLETRFVRPTALRIEWQLYELTSGNFLRIPPKDDSYRTIDMPGWLIGLLTDHIARTRPQPCPCHGRTYVFRGQGTFRPDQTRPKITDVAKAANVSPNTVYNVIRQPGKVTAATTAHVLDAMSDLGFNRSGDTAMEAPHWRRRFGPGLLSPAVSGWYPKKGEQEARPVPLLASPWPGLPLRGRGADARAEACWAPIAPGLTPHGLGRHTHKTRLRALRTPPKLINERLGHADGSVQDRYDHITPEMRQELLEGLTREWEQALDARLALCPRSPVAVLDRLLRERAAVLAQRRTE